MLLPQSVEGGEAKGVLVVGGTNGTCHSYEVSDTRTGRVIWYYLNLFLVPIYTPFQLPSFALRGFWRVTAATGPHSNVRCVELLSPEVGVFATGSADGSVVLWKWTHNAGDRSAVTANT